MAKEKFEELWRRSDANPELRRDKEFLRTYNHHQTIIETKYGGKNLYLDAASRDKIIAESETPLEALNKLIFPAAIDYRRDFKGDPISSKLSIERSRFLPEDWHGKARRAEINAPIFQREALEEYAGRADDLSDEDVAKLLKLVDKDKEVRDQAWDELHKLLDKHEEKQLAKKSVLGK